MRERDVNMDLDTNSPAKVESLLRAAVGAYRADAVELQSAWQDANAGQDWLAIAAILERAADRIAKRV